MRQFRLVPFRPSRPVPSRPVPSVPSGRTSALAHPIDNPTKSCTRRPPWAGWDLDPIQPFTEPAFGRFWLPDENGRRYSNTAGVAGL